MDELHASLHITRKTISYLPISGSSSGDINIGGKHRLLTLIASIGYTICILVLEG